MAPYSPRKLEISEEELRTRPVPNYIVLFRAISENNIETMARVRHTSARAEMGSVVVLDAKEPGGPLTRVFTRIGAAATDLTDTEKADLEKSETVLRVVPNQLRSLSPVEVHARAALNTASTISPGAELPLTWALQMMGIDEGYSHTTGRGVRVALLDSGVEFDHPDLHGRVDPANSKCFISSPSTVDKYGHGTHCAGIIAGHKNSTSGIRFAVAPDVVLFAGKVLNDFGAGYDDGVIDGVNWAVSHGIRIISMSLGSRRALNAPAAATYEGIASLLLEEDPGCLLIAAAGNSSKRPSIVSPIGNPAACDSVVAVSAITPEREIAEFSCGGVQGDSARVNFTAPGVDVYSCGLNGTFRYDSGTSMAVPHVAATAALVLEQLPKLTAADLWKRLDDLSEDLGDAGNFGRGLVKVPRAR